MSTKKLKKQNELADMLVQKMNWIREAWMEVPGQEEIDELTDAVGKLVRALQQAKQAFQSEDFPTVDDLAELAKEAGHLAGHLQEASNATGAEGKNRGEPSRPVHSHQLL